MESRSLVSPVSFENHVSRLSCDRATGSPGMEESVGSLGRPTQEPDGLELDSSSAGLIPVHSKTSEDRKAFPYEPNSDQERAKLYTSPRKKRICGLPRLTVIGLLILLLLGIGLGLGLGVGLGRRKRKSDKVLNCPNRNAPSSLNALVGTGLAFAARPKRLPCTSKKCTVANLYYQEPAQNKIRVHQLWGDGSWTDKELPTSFVPMSKTPLSVVSLTIDQDLTWLVMFIDEDNHVTSFTYQDPDFEEQVTLHIEPSNGLSPYNTDKPASFQACPYYYDSRTIGGTPPKDYTPVTNETGAIIWYPTSATTYTYLMNNALGWSQEGHVNNTPTNKGVYCHSSEYSSKFHVMFVNTTTVSNDTYEVYTMDTLSDDPLQTCPYGYTIPHNSTFLSSDGVYFYFQAQAGFEEGIYVHNSTSLWSCKNTGHRDTTWRKISRGLSGTRLGSAIIHGKDDKETHVIAFQNASGEIIGYEISEGNIWSESVNLLSC
ncbi:hypothetical protein K470DRAFT_260221 [Piedraia hortae CBS 480.64]|uniref:Fucose-specific lectin n=1 Tax=Piedraia hortae CBS 480.64 TaxID=1314780 RepID=A0A6A7BTL7_9PEZI|nr:hypothetical protein K470DRAFT_260221 [Piedraia hortae CBS 480.64]